MKLVVDCIAFERKKNGECYKAIFGKQQYPRHQIFSRRWFPLDGKVRRKEKEEISSNRSLTCYISFSIFIFMEINFLVVLFIQDYSG